jgi:predicted dienelactone hydrolase
LNKRQRATLTIATTAFQVLARTQAKALGQPGLPVAIIPHPLGPRSRKELQDIVDQQLEAMVKLVCERGKS